MPFLLDLLHLPGDIFQFYLASGIFVSQLGTMGSAMHLFALAVLGGFVMAGALRLQWKRLIPVTALALGVVAATVIGARVFFFPLRSVIPRTKPNSSPSCNLYFPPARQSLQIAAAFAGAIAAIRIEKDPRARRSSRRLSRRAASFHLLNEQGNLVGLDIEMAQVMAHLLGVAVEFVPVQRATMFEELNAGYCDIVMSGNSPDARSNRNGSLFGAVPGCESGLCGPGLPPGGIRQ